MHQRAKLWDGMALALSSLCLVHCLLLPLAMTLLPLIATMIVLPESLHRVLAVLALPVSAMAIIPAWRRHHIWSALLFAAIGLLLLAIGAFAMKEGAEETVVTVAGATSLAFAHIRNWTARHHRLSAGSTDS